MLALKEVKLQREEMSKNYESLLTVCGKSFVKLVIEYLGMNVVRGIYQGSKLSTRPFALGSTKTVK